MILFHILKILIFLRDCFNFNNICMCLILELRGRVLSELDRSGCSINKYSTNLCRSRSAQSLKLLGDSASADDKMTILAQLFWLSVSLLESDYEHEFLLALRLLGRVLHRLPLDRPDARDKVEKLQTQLRWNNFPGVHALLLKVIIFYKIYFFFFVRILLKPHLFGQYSGLSKITYITGYKIQ